MFKFIWRIENLSVFLLSEKEFIESPAFEIKCMNNVKAHLRLYTGSKRACYGFRNYSIRLLDDSAAFEVGTKVKLSITKNKNSSEFGEFKIVSHSKSHLHPCSSTDLISEMVKFQDLFLSTDNVSVECVFLKPNSNEIAFIPVTCRAKTVVQIERHTYDFSLRGFYKSPNRNQNVEYSRTFSVEQYTGCFELTLAILEKFESDCTVEIRKFFQLNSAILVCCKVSLLRADAKKDLKCVCNLFKGRAGTESWKITLCGEQMENFSILQCEIIVSKGTTVSTLENGNLPAVTATCRGFAKVCIGKSLLSNKAPPAGVVCIKSDKNSYTLLKNMYETLKFSDMILQVGTDQFQAHKCVLGNVSDVFSAMFTNKMQEKEINIVNITDIEKDIIGKMLQFVYTGEVENLDLHSLKKLFSAADKYQILELKKLCSLHLKEMLTTDSCLDLLEFADMHHDSDLVDAARNFIYDNRKEILDSDGWKGFMGRRVELAADLMFHICKRS